MAISRRRFLSWVGAAGAGMAIPRSTRAGSLEHFYEAVNAGATILLAASMFHFGIIQIGELKTYLRDRGVNVR